MESKSRRTFNFCVHKKSIASASNEDLEQDRQEIIQAKHKSTKSAKRLASKLRYRSPFQASNPMVKKNAKMEFQDSRVNKKRTEYARKNLQSVQKKDVQHTFVESPMDFVVEIKKEELDLETENLIQLASCLHSHDNPAIIENLPLNMPESPTVEDSAESSLDSINHLMPVSPEYEENVEFYALHDDGKPTSNECRKTTELEENLEYCNPLSNECRNTTELVESHEYYIPDSTQLINIGNPCAVTEEEEQPDSSQLIDIRNPCAVTEEEEQDSPEFLSCATAVEIDRVPLTYESRFDAKASNDQANDALSAFEIEGECMFDVDGEETVLAKADIEPSTEAIGVIGCGPMAKAIICFLIKSRHNVFAYNRTKERLLELPVNPTIVSSPADLVEKCNIILSCVSDASAVENIMDGPDGVLEGLELNPDKAFVEMSSVNPKIISNYAEKVDCRRGHYLTAQIGRTRPALYLGCSLITASGDRSTFLRCQSCFAAFATNVVYVSANVEEASVLSVINSVIESVSIINVADVLLSIEKLKMPRSFLLEMLEFQPAQIPLLRVAAINMLENRELVFLPLKHVVKNIIVALDLKKSSYFGDEYLVTALQICKEILCHYPDAQNHDISCVYKLRSDYTEEQ